MFQPPNNTGLLGDGRKFVLLVDIPVARGFILKVIFPITCRCSTTKLIRWGTCHIIQKTSTSIPCTKSISKIGTESICSLHFLGDKFEISRIIRERIEEMETQKSQSGNANCANYLSLQLLQSAALPALGVRNLRVVDFALSRAGELKLFTNSIKERNGTKRAFQTLPRHLRRRTMSHNVYRVPKKLRDRAILEVIRTNSAL
jgi:hypothetical protein